MFLLENNSLFTLNYCPSVIANEGDLVFVYQKKQIGLTPTHELPVFKKDVTSEKYSCFGYLDQRKCLISNEHTELLNLHYNEVRTSHQFLSKEAYQAAAIGYHIFHFKSTHRYCGCCGSLMTDMKSELALICVSCSHITYPKISPCVIVLITRGEEMLLARSPHFAPNVMSTLAGFVSIGESIEQTVVREVMEEVGIEIGNLRYICSQPWPFPDSLMLGFMADYIQGTITIDRHEIESAGWFTKNHLPTLPNKMSIARYLIDMHLNAMQNQ